MKNDTKCSDYYNIKVVMKAHGQLGNSVSERLNLRLKDYTGLCEHVVD